MRKKEHGVFVSESEMVKQTFHLIENELANLCEKDVSPIKIKLSDIPALPRKWKGYEFPLPLNCLNEQELKRFHGRLIEELREGVVEDIAWRIYDNAKNRKVIYVGAMLISRCRKNKGPGLLFYWKK